MGSWMREAEKDDNHNDRWRCVYIDDRTKITWGNDGADGLQRACAARDRKWGIKPNFDEYEYAASSPEAEETLRVNMGLPSEKVGPTFKLLGSKINIATGRTFEEKERTDKAMGRPDLIHRALVRNEKPRRRLVTRMWAVPPIT